MDDSSAPGLRERKKAKTRAIIQAEALRLFREQGYEETTIEQIAEAAEVSLSTVFRYFPTKPDLVIYDSFDERFMELFRAQPPQLDTFASIRGILDELLKTAFTEDMRLQMERASLMQMVPELRGAMLNEFTRTLGEVRTLIAERERLPADDDRIITLSGAVLGMLSSAFFYSFKPEGYDWIEHFKRIISRGFDLLELGFNR